MRFVVLGAGAIGGVVGARLHQAGQEVQLIARGAHYEAIAGCGLRLQAPGEDSVLELAVADAPQRIQWTADDVVLLATKTQDTAAALASLTAVAPPEIALVCMQNGVENERLALRVLPNVYGCVVMVPSAHLQPGVVQAFAGGPTGILDLGRYPGGVDDRAEAIAAALSGAGFSSRPDPEIMRSKYAKLLLNLGNAAEAICGPEADTTELVGLAEAEGRSALTSAGISFEVDERDATRRSADLPIGAAAGAERGGGSTWQSLARGASAVEADYLNGEIVLLGRQHAVATPVNELLRRLVNRLARAGAGPGSLTPEEVRAQLSAVSGAGAHRTYCRR